jgi:predicted amidohydrolase YtcJ
MDQIFRARLIRTMDPRRPTATHVAVRHGRILEVGDASLAARWPHVEVDERFARQTLLPGFIEGHAHADAGGMWGHTYCGSSPRRAPDGRTVPALSRIDEVIDRLAADAAVHPEEDDKTLLGWGFDPMFCERALTRQDLDRLPTRRPVLVVNASGHIMYASTRALQRCDLLPPLVAHEGIRMGEDGLPSGELRGAPVTRPVTARLGVAETLLGVDGAALRSYGRMCVQAGVTTASDLASLMTPAVTEALCRTTAEPDFPCRIVPAMLTGTLTPPQLMAKALELRRRSHDRLHLGAIKLVIDGSIQGFTARLRQGTYANGAPNGLWYIAPETLSAFLEAALQAEVQVHAHTNGDQASALLLERLEKALRLHPRDDHRTMLQHAQLVDQALLEVARRLGAGVNLFANHLYYWGDEHARQTVGPLVARRMNPCATAQRVGLPWSIHSDDPVTPMAPLFTAWCAVNRLTRSGVVLGEDERVDVATALQAITMGSAWTLRLDHCVGSITPGKFADFAVLDQDPLETPPEELKDIPVWGTVLSGRPQPARTH